MKPIFLFSLEPFHQDLGFAIHQTNCNTICFLGSHFFETLFLFVETTLEQVETINAYRVVYFASSIQTKIFKTMQRNTLSAGLVAIFLFMGCATPNVTTEKKEWKPIYRAQLGTNKGGVVENTDLTVVPNTQVDAYSGATSKGVNASGKVILPLKRNALETGIDLMHNSQTFSYNDAANGFNGERKLGVTQFMVPITYSFCLFRKNNPEGLLQIKLGYSAQFNLISTSDGTGNMPIYSTSPYSKGATLGFSTTPFRLKNGAKLGFYIDGYRGTQAYEDFYNRTEFEMPGTAFIKYGVIYQF
jgi:hypothetical protein